MTDAAYCESLRNQVDDLRASLDHRTLVMGAAIKRAEKAEARVRELETVASKWDALFVWGDDFSGYEEELALHCALHRTKDSNDADAGEPLPGIAGEGSASSRTDLESEEAQPASASAETSRHHDVCDACLGNSGAVPGNGNVLVLCDYCTCKVRNAATTYTDTSDEPPMFREGSPTYRCAICKRVNRGDEVATFGDYATCSDACSNVWLDACVGQGRMMRALRAEIEQLKKALAEKA